MLKLIGNIVVFINIKAAVKHVKLFFWVRNDYPEPIP